MYYQLYISYIFIRTPTATRIHLLSILRALAADAAGELDILRHDGNALRVECAEVGIFEEADEVGLGSFLEGENRRALEPKWFSDQGLEVLGDLTDEALERELADEELGGLLVPADVAEGNSTGAVAMRFLERKRTVSEQR